MRQCSNRQKRRGSLGKWGRPSRAGLHTGRLPDCKHRPEPVEALAAILGIEAHELVYRSHKGVRDASAGSGAGA